MCACSKCLQTDRELKNMSMNVELQTLTAEGLRQFQALRADAVSAVTERFYATHGSTLHLSLIHI